MSRLQDRIRRALRVEARPMGFGTTSRPEGPTLLLLASLPASVPKGKIETPPVDSVVVNISDVGADGKALPAIVDALGDIPCGVRLPAADRSAATALKEAGVDYLVFDADQAAASLLLEEQIGLVMDASPDMSEQLLRVLPSLPLNGLYIDLGELPLTVRRQIELRHLAGLAQQGLLVRVNGEPESEVLESLRTAGAVGIVVEVAKWADLPGLEGLQKRITDLPPRRRRREEQREAILPAIGRPRDLLEEEEEETP